MARISCPICGSSNRSDNWSMSFLVPDNWTLPTNNDIHHCNTCGMIWYDNNKTQEDYDTYYKKMYSSFNSTNSINHSSRFEELAQIVIGELQSNYDALIVDIGGGAGELCSILREKGYHNTQNSDIGMGLPNKISMIVCANVLEHIYDLDLFVGRLSAHLDYGGKLLIELPDSSRMMFVENMPILDFQQQHINHFTPKTLDLLMLRDEQLSKVWGVCPKNEYNGYFLYRALFKKEMIGMFNTHFISKITIENALEQVICKLRLINFPVIVWGCGDLAMHLLTKVNLNVVHFVDLNPAFVGETINGIRVLDRVEGDFPILIMAQLHKNSILKSIKNLGLTNEVIVI
jgi:hypothetical protein